MSMPMMWSLYVCYIASIALLFFAIHSGRKRVVYALLVINTLLGFTLAAIGGIG